MTISASVLFNRPQQEIAGQLRSLLSTSSKTQIVAGFLTVEGVELLKGPIEKSPGTLDTLVVGAGTYRAFEAMDKLLAAGVRQSALYVHLGHCRHTGASARHRFYRYHPMLHSKVYYMERANGSAVAVIGSHNVTGFALAGLNGEAAVLLEGPKNDAEFDKVRDHISEARRQSVQYSPSQKDALAWWTREAIAGLQSKANDQPRDSSAKKTIVIIAENKNAEVPVKDDVVYFELPLALGQVTSLYSEVHLYVFDKLPSTPWAALQSLGSAIGSCWCRPVGLEMQQGGTELQADWEIASSLGPKVMRTSSPFRPSPGKDMQQIRVQVRNRVFGDFEYLFDSGSSKWTPRIEGEQTGIFEIDSDHASLSLSAEYRPAFDELNLIPPEHLPWLLVRELVPDEKPSTYQSLLSEFSPERGSFIMLSLRRRERAE